MMEGKTIQERARYGYTVLHRTQDLIKAKYPDLQIVYKREWQGRKSGRNKGESCPHYHFMAYGPGWTDEQYAEMFTQVALKWISYSKTEEIGKALAVIMHRKSFGFLREYDGYVTYFAKYVSKKSTIEGEGIGRFWGMIGLGRAGGRGRAEGHGRRNHPVEEIPSAIPAQHAKAQEEAKRRVRSHGEAEAEIREGVEK